MHDMNTNKERTRLTAAARPLIYYNEFNKVVRLDWVVKGILAKGHTSYLYGPPGSGKSSLYGSVAIHLGVGLDWHGFKIRKKFATVCFAMERADLVQKRIWAECQREGLGEVSVAVCPGSVNLMDPKCVDMIIGTILKAEDKFGMEAGLSTFDTFGKGIAAAGGDENLARDQNRAWGHLRLVHEGLARYHSIHIMAIGHTGKDESRGARGSNAADGDNDVSLQIRNSGGIKDVSIYKANELPEGPLMRFKMEPYDTGLKDEDGDTIKVWIAADELIEAGAATERKTGRRISDRQQLAMNTLTETVLSHGKPSPASYGLPKDIKAVTADQWREELFRSNVLDRTAANPRTDFRRLHDQLLARCAIGSRDEYVWAVRS